MNTQKLNETKEMIADVASVYLDRAHLLIEDFQARWFESREVSDETIYDVQARYATMQAHLDAIIESIVQARIRLNATLGESDEGFDGLMNEISEIKTVLEALNNGKV